MKYLPTAFMLIFLGVGFIMSLFNPVTFNSPQGHNFIKGEWTAAYEKQFNDNLPIRQLAIDTWGVLEYLFFREGREGVLVGTNGWLYTNEEFLRYSNGEKAFRDKLQLAITAKKRLEQQEVSFLVVVVPDKARIYPEYLGRYEYPTYLEARYETFIETLRDEGVDVVDLRQPLLQAKTNEDVFLRTDTHWTPFGTEAAATAIAHVVEAKELLPSFANTVFRTEKLSLIEHKGDLLSFIPLGKLQERLGPPFDILEERVTEQENNALGLFGSETIPVTLVGTSYSANPNWHFEGHLKAALGADVLNMADEGLGPVQPLESYLKSDELSDTPPELVIWEVPERFIFDSD